MVWPTLLYALVLGYTAPSTYLLDNGQDRTFLVRPDTLNVSFTVESQWGPFFLGGKVATDSDTTYNGGFRPLQADYRVWGGMSFFLGDVRVTVKGEHECLHPISSFTALGPTANGFYGGRDYFVVQFSSSGEIHGDF